MYLDLLICIFIVTVYLPYNLFWLFSMLPDLSAWMILQVFNIETFKWSFGILFSRLVSKFNYETFEIFCLIHWKKTMIRCMDIFNFFCLCCPNTFQLLSCIFTISLINKCHWDQSLIFWSSLWSSKGMQWFIWMNLLDFIILWSTGTITLNGWKGCLGSVGRYAESQLWGMIFW